MQRVSVLFSEEKQNRQMDWVLLKRLLSAGPEALDPLVSLQVRELSCLQSSANEEVGDESLGCYILLGSVMKLLAVAFYYIADRVSGTGERGRINHLRTDFNSGESLEFCTALDGTVKLNKVHFWCQETWEQEPNSFFKSSSSRERAFVTT